MALPGSSITILDGGLGVTTPATSVPHVIGVFETGDLNTPTTVANLRVLAELFGTHGQGNDLAGYILANSGGPVIVTRVDPTVPGGYAAPGSTGVGGTSYETTEGGTDSEISFVIATSAPKNDFDVQIRITTGGARADTKFQYSLDGGSTMSGILSAAASVPLGTTGVTAEFEAGATSPYVAGNVYNIRVLGPHYNGTDLGDAFDAIEQSLLFYDFFALAGEAPTASAQASLFSTLASRLNTLESAKSKFKSGILQVGDDTPANILTAFNSSISLRLTVAQSWFRAASPFSIIGRAQPRLKTVAHVANREAGNLMSTDLAQTALAASVGPIVGCTEIGHDEFLNEAGLDAAKISTLRTYPNLDGFFLTNAWIKSPSGSDFEFVQHRRIMDAACRAVDFKHSQLISSMVITKADGTGALTESSAQTIERFVQRELDNVIGSGLRSIGPVAIDGRTGHVSDIRYQVDRNNNVLSTKQLIATIAIVPRGYLKALTATVSYALQV
jgi:hypothetical protein